MVTVREPVLKPVAIASLRPTQITVGVREVQDRRRRWRALKSKKLDFLGTHMIPVILGPKDRHYIIDHHHLALALHEEGAGGACFRHRQPKQARPGHVLGRTR